MAMMRGLRQVARHASDLDRAVGFYRDTLGLTLVARFDPPGLVFFDLGGVRLLVERGHLEGQSVLYLDVDDIDAAYASLKERGVVFDDEPHLIHRDDDGTFGPAGEEEWMAFFRDPDGGVLGLASRRRPSSVS
jgi:methylmalonyl-CoA/ethylmalonyl-CoA epimerase